MLDIFIDADACPFKKETYKVADRYQMKVFVVANSWIKIPDDKRYVLKLVNNELDAADDWIISKAATDDIVITADIPLTNQCLKNGAHVIGAHGRLMTNNNIADVLATRDLLTGLRSAGEMTGGPPPIKKMDRSNFLQQLDQVIQKVYHKNKRPDK